MARSARDRQRIENWRPTRDYSRRKPAPAAVSWWVGLSREQFAERAAVEAARLIEQGKKGLKSEAEK